MNIDGTEWCQQKLAELQINASKLDILTEIRNRLLDNGAPESGISMNFLQSPALFDCLQIDTSPEQTQIATDILSICISSLQIDNEDCSTLLTQSLKQRKTEIRSVVLHELRKKLRKHPEIQSLDFELTMAIITCVDDIESCVSVPATEILSQILINNFDHPDIQTAFSVRLEKGNSIRLRAYEIAVNLAKTSPGMLDKMNNTLDSLVNELKTDDVLYILNVLELMVSLAEQNHGLVYMENKNVFRKINKRIEGFENNPLDKLLIPGYMKFFGKIAYIQPQRIIEGYPNMIACLFDCIVSEDMTVLPTAFDTLANIAHSNDGKILLDNKFSEKMKESFEEFASYLRNLPTDMKNRAFNSLEDIFRPSGEPNEITEKITQKWCKFLTMSDNFHMFLEFCKNPIPDIKVSCLSLVKTLCLYRWAIVSIKNTAGFVEYLLDRRIEFDKEARFIKYQINEILSNSSVFDGQTIVLLKKFVNEGPYYVEGIVDVAVEGGT